MCIFMNCSLYEFYWLVNTFMKFILVVYMCLAGSCESVFEQKLYETREQCEISGQEVKEYAMINFPQSSGEVWCLTEDQFKEYQDYYDQTQES
jgi:hypothetical protein